MAIAIFSIQFAALWAGLFALGTSALAFKALAARKLPLFLACTLACGILVYVAITFLPYLPRQ
jgi:hypothetical protein